jgi:hypothetical protein
MSIVRIAEALKPLTSITTRYTDVKKERNAFSHYNGYSYFDKMFYTARHKKQNGKLSSVPYATFDDVTILNGTARPYKGDRCVFTSEDIDPNTKAKSLKINIYSGVVNGEITYPTTLYIKSKETAIVKSIPCANETTIDLRAALSELEFEDFFAKGGIYYVYTDVDVNNGKNTTTEVESFEYFNVTPVDFMISNNNVRFMRNGDDVTDFWYALVEVKGNEYLNRSHEIACVECKKDKDYSGWFENNQVIENVEGVYYKGTYGAYVVPVNNYIATQEEGD